MAIKGCHFDYANQAWTVDGLYQDCGHPKTSEARVKVGMSDRPCGCYGREHAGEPPALNADMPTLTR